MVKLKRIKTSFDLYEVLLCLTEDCNTFHLGFGEDIYRIARAVAKKYPEVED